MFKQAIKAVRKGNEYRLAKYGPSDTMEDSYLKARAYVAARRKEQVGIKILWSDEECRLSHEFKKQFGYWDCWTGARFDRVENPEPTKTTDLHAVCRSDPLTGKWYAL